MPANERVFEHIKGAIQARLWRPQDRIPSEADLSRELGVNRLTVRAAIQRLIGMGLLETRIGDGTYVKAFSFHDYIEKVTDFYMNPEMLDDVCDFRKAIELPSMRLAMERATPADWEALEQLCREYDAQKQRVGKDYSHAAFASLIETDLAFHEKICEMSRNQLFIYTFEVAREPIYQYLLVILNKRIESWVGRGFPAEKWNDLHAVIYEAMRAGDYPAAEKAYLDMVDRGADL